MTTGRKTQQKYLDHFKTAGKKMGETKTRVLDTTHMQTPGMGTRVHKKHGEKSRKILRGKFTIRRKCGMVTTAQNKKGEAGCT